jgi:hypothetical protein
LTSWCEAIIILFKKREVSAMATGRVKFYDIFKGFGFIEPDDGSKDVYLHSREVKEAGLDFLGQ